MPPPDGDEQLAQQHTDDGAHGNGQNGGQRLPVRGQGDGGEYDGQGDERHGDVGQAFEKATASRYPEGPLRIREPLPQGQKRRKHRQIAQQQHHQVQGEEAPEQGGIRAHRLDGSSQQTHRRGYDPADQGRAHGHLVVLPPPGEHGGHISPLCGIGGGGIDAHGPGDHVAEQRYQKQQGHNAHQHGLAPEPSKLDGVAIGNDLEIVSTGRYAGLFVEDGSDETVSDVFCIRVKNTGSTGVQYAHITLTRGGECYEFDITTLLPGETVQALELSRQTLPEKPAELTAAVTTYAPFSETPSMHDDVLEVAASQNGITVTNRSDVAMSQVYVYYKNASGDLLLGGITYRAGLTDLGPGETRTCYAGHYSQDSSRLLFVTYAP